MDKKQLRLLTMVMAGEKVKLVRVNAGHGLNIRLASMGLHPNVEMTVVKNSHPGPFVISVKDSRMMLGRGVAEKIEVVDVDR
jgi:ferrous iron transport protein A